MSCYISSGKILLCLIFSLLLSWGCMPCDTFSVPLLVLCKNRLLHVVIMIRINLAYYEVILLYQVGIIMFSWNQILRICKYMLICGERFLIFWSNLDLLLPAVRFRPTIEDESLCLRWTPPLWNGYWMFELISMYCLLCDDLDEITDTWCSWISLSPLKQ